MKRYKIVYVGMRRIPCTLPDLTLQLFNFPYIKDSIRSSNVIVREWNENSIVNVVHMYVFWVF